MRLLVLRRLTRVACLTTFALVGAGLHGQNEGLIGPLSDGSMFVGSLEIAPNEPSPIPHPARFLGYPLGDRFTSHERMLAYLAALDSATERISTVDYGTSTQGRPLKLLLISTPQNLAKIDELRRNNLRLADPQSLPPRVIDELKRTQPAIVWFAFGVHGNETSSSEAAMAVAYQLAAASEGSAIAKLLDELIIVIDPLSNPDGRERYRAFYENARGEEADPNPNAAEHQEPWPGGRLNHYLFDLNRDWAWISQIETRARLAAYRLWEPQIYVDFHEMGAEQTYFFPPAADPVHPLLADLDPWLETFGRANAAAFDQRGWLYFIREEYDLFYPGYGDTYPSLRGAIGMTYEVAGGARAGTRLRLDNGELLTLGDRVARHNVTAFATLGVAANKRRDLVRDFVERRKPNLAKRTYLWSADLPEARALAELLGSHGIVVEQLGQNSKLRVTSLLPGGEVERSFAQGTFAVRTSQPLGRLVEALIGIEAELAEDFVIRQEERVADGLSAELYDITAWSLPMAFNIEAWAFSGEPSGLRPAEARDLRRSTKKEEAAVGYLIKSQGLAGYRLASLLLDQGIRLRFVTEAFDGDASTRGSFFVPRQGNGADLDARLEALIGDQEVLIEPVKSSWNDLGPALGSRKQKRIVGPRVGVVGGPGVDALSFGFAWHLLDQRLEIDVSRLDGTRFSRVDLTDLDVLVLPDGLYSDLLSGSATKIEGFVRAGGRIVAIGGAIDWLRANELSKIDAWKPAEQPLEDPIDPSRKKLETELEVPGIILATEWVGEHDLSAGLMTPPPTLFSGSRVYLPTHDPRIDVLVVRGRDPVLAGLVLPDALPRLQGALLVAVEKRGQGHVVSFAQDPNFRAFWRGTMPLFLNAVLIGP